MAISAQIPGVAEGVDRHAGQDGGFSLRGHDLLAYLAGEPAWSDAVDADVVSYPFHGQTPLVRPQTAALLVRRESTSVKPTRAGHAADVDDPSLEPALSQVGSRSGSG